MFRMNSFWNITRKDFISFEKRVESYYDACEILYSLRYNLSRSGFFYVGYGKTIECFSCGIRIYTWFEDDCPFKEHRDLSQDCIFIKSVEQ